MGPTEAPAQASGVDGAPAARVSEQPDADAKSPVSDVTALPQALKILGSVVAPTTLLTALMYYFGRQAYAGFFWYVGADVTVFDLTVQDYLNNSVTGFIPPLIAVAVAALLALWVHQLLVGGLPTETRRIVLRVLIPAAAMTGLVLVCLALADLVMIPVFRASFPEGRGLSLSIGVLLLAYAARLLRPLIVQRGPQQVPRRAPGAVAVAEWGAVFILVSVGLFWAVGSYAVGVGVRYAQDLEMTLPSRPDVVAYSDKGLSLQAPGVREVTCQDADTAYRFRYDGLKLVLQSGNQYLLLPSGWTHAHGAAILIPRSDKIRLEFSPPGQIRNATC
ncbi:MAG: hypothetical protein ACRDRO_12690 [Pseudonocardiaceae bacterium]